MRLEEVVDKILVSAYEEAKIQGHEYFTPEHILFASLHYEEGKDIIESCGGDVDKILKDLKSFFKNKILVIKGVEPIESFAVSNIMQNTAVHILASGKDKIRLGDIYVSIFEEKESFAAYILRKHGVEKLDVLKYISYGMSDCNNVQEEFEHDNKYEFDEYEELEELEENLRTTDLLSKYTVELVEKAINGDIDPFIGREDILKRTIQVLSRRLKNNPIHVGEPGVGKTAITEGLARLIAGQNAPRALKDSKIYCLDMGTMIAGTKYRGDFEDRIKKVLKEIEKEKNAIVYIDEIHNIIGTGSVSGGSMDASSILKPLLQSGKVRFIGSTTYDEYKKIFDKDRALSRRFQKIEVLEPTIDETYEILKGLKEKYEAFHGVFYSEEILKLTCELTSKYVKDRFLPDKAIDIIDEVGAHARLSAGDNEDIIKITEKDIEHTVSLIAKIPEKSVSTDEVYKLKMLENELKCNIFGQDNAIETIARAIKRSRAGFNDGEKPVASLLFVGPTGVGKTEITRQLAGVLSIPLVRFDMSEYQEKHTVARLIGAPPGYVGYEEGGLLTDAIRKTPYCVLLLDEIEKAHPDIFNVLLQIMDYATLTDNNGRKADFRNVIIIMTSNAGAREVGKSMIGFEKRIIDKTLITKEVEKIFSPEFRNRLDEIVVFKHLNMEMAVLIAQKAINQFKQKLISKNIEINATPDCIKWLAEKGMASNYGAREILRVVQEKIKTYFVDEVLFGSLSKGGNVTVDVKGEDVLIKREGQ